MDWVEQISRTNPVIGYLNKSYLGGKIKAVIDKELQPSLLARNECMFGHLPSLSTQGSILHHKGPNTHVYGHRSRNIQVMFTSPEKSHPQELGIIWVGEFWDSRDPENNLGRGYRGYRGNVLFY